MESTTTRQFLKSQYFTIHKNHEINGSHAGQPEALAKFESLAKLTQDAILFLNSVTFEERFSILNFRQLVGDALKEFRNHDHSVIESHIIVGVKNLEKYGLNLCLYPWRKEFILLKLHSGFFKCNVEIHFKPAKEVLEKFGYKEVSPQELTIVDRLNPNCSQSDVQLVVEKVQEIVFDLFLMSVELKQLIPVLQFADKEGYTFDDAFRSRRRTVGDVKESLRWLEMNAWKSSAVKRAKYDVLHNVESLNDVDTQKISNRKEDGTNENEDEERILRWHQQNLEEKLGARTRDMKYPPGIKVESGLLPTAQQQSASDIPHTQQHETIRPREFGNGIVTSGYGASVRGPFIGPGMVQSDYDDAELYGHNGNIDNVPAADQSLSKEEIKIQPITNVTISQSQVHDPSTEDYVSMGSFLNSDGGTYQTPTAKPHLNGASGTAGAVFPASPSHDANDAGDYVFIDDALGQSVGKTEKPPQYPGQAMRINPNETSSLHSKSFHHENNELQRQTRKENQKDDVKDLPLLVKDRLNIQQSETRSAPATITNITDNRYYNASIASDQLNKFSRHSCCDLAFSNATKNIGKQSGRGNQRIYSTCPEHKRTTHDSERNYSSDPSLIGRFQDQFQSSSSAKLSSAVSSSSSTVLVQSSNSTGQYNPQQSATIQNFNSGYSENFRKNPSHVSTSTSTLTTSSSVKTTVWSVGDAAVSVKLPPVVTVRRNFQEGSGANAQQQSKPVSGETLCDHCMISKGSAICNNCFIVSCDICQEIFDADLCPKPTTGGVKGAHKFVKLSSKQMKRNKISSLSSNPSSERFSRDKVSDKAQPDGGGQEKWSCERCTMLNSPENTVCCACASTQGMEQPAPLQAGSRVCLECTFHNKEGADVCEMCHKTLISTVV